MKKKKESGGVGSYNFASDDGFTQFGCMILPKHEFCKCGIYKENGLISASEGFIVWKI